MISTPQFKTFFEMSLKESENIPSNPNTSGNGGVFGSAASLGAQGSASGTTGRDTYAPGDYRTPKSLFKKPLRRKKKGSK